MTNTSRLALIAAVAAVGIASPALAQTATPEVIQAYPMGTTTPAWWGPNNGPHAGPLASGAIAPAPVLQVQPKQGPLYNYVTAPNFGMPLFRIGDDGGIAAER